MKRKLQVYIDVVIQRAKSIEPLYSTFIEQRLAFPGVVEQTVACTFVSSIR